MTAEAGGLVEGTVVRLAHYGAFVQLPDGQLGLVHISEIADAYVSNIADHLSVGDRVTVRVLRVDDEGRYQLSVKRAKPDWHEPKPRSGHPPGDSFEDKLQRFMKESQERQLELKRHTEGKRGRSRRG